MLSRFLPLLAALLTAAGLASAAPSTPTVAPVGDFRWTAKWIWTEGDAAPRNSYTYFRKILELETAPKEARVHLTADSRYQLFVNGAFVGRGPVRSDRRWLYYDTWDVAPHLKKGKNVLAVLVHHYGEWTFQYMQGRGGLLAEVVGAGGQRLARSDWTWKARRSEAWSTGQPRMSIQLGFNEIYDARKEPPDWKAATFDDGAWRQAVEIGAPGMEPWPNLVPRDIPAMLEEPLRARAVLETMEGESAAEAQYVDLLPLMEPKGWGAAYLATTLVSADRRPVELKFGSDDAIKVWLNGKPVVSHLIDRAAAPDQESARVTLEPGENSLLAKVVQGHTAWEYYFRLGTGGEGVRLRGAPGSAPEQVWSVAGPFTFPQAVGIRGGFETRFPPEEKLDLGARYTHEGRELAWRPVAAAVRSFEHVSQQMAVGRRRELDRARVENPSALLDRSGWTRVRTGPGRDVSFLIDFGKEVTGFPRFRLRGARGGEIVDTGYGEVLHDETGGFIPQSSDKIGRLNPDRDGVHYADRYVCRPGDQEFQTFDKRGFRYLQLDVRNAPDGLELQDVSLLFSTFPVENRGAFHCSDERLNQIWVTGRYTCQLNMEDAYTDCAWRERGQWWGDARVEALINYYCFGDTTLIRKALRQKGQSLNDEGMTWGVYPTDWDGGRLPSFTLIWVSTLWDTYEYTADAGIVRELFPKVRATLDRFFAQRVGPRGLLKDVPYWVFIDWAPVETAGESASLNAYYYDALRCAERMARLLDDPSAAEYGRRAEAVRTAMHTHLWDPAAHAYRDSVLPDGKRSTKFSQQANSLCVLFDIAPLDEQARVLDFIYASENKAGVVEAGSPYFSYYLLAALFHAGRHEQALRYIRERWGRMLDWGATTWWEMWNPGASFCHGWSGGPTFNLSAEYLGVQPLKPGFAEVRIAPHFADLKYATGIVPTVKGDVRVAWQHDEKGGNVALRVETPEGVPAEVTLPVTGELRINKKSKLPKGVTLADPVPGTTRLRIEGGKEVLVEVRASSR
jgi:alpha-L-rhamnosidase